VIIAFTKVKLPYGWLSNMSGYSVVYEGAEWRTTEHLFQALRFSDLEVHEAIRSHKSPMTAKFYAKARKDQMKVVPMSEEDVNNMRLCLRLKIGQHPDLFTELLATKEQTIIEDCTKRQHGSGLFWGAAKQEDGSWKGENMLGKLWMEVRNVIT
jgi:N-glycosidase YbiA